MSGRSLVVAYVVTVLSVYISIAAAATFRPFR